MRQGDLKQKGTPAKAEVPRVPHDAVLCGLGPAVIGLADRKTVFEPVPQNDLTITYFGTQSEGKIARFLTCFCQCTVHGSKDGNGIT